MAQIVAFSLKFFERLPKQDKDSESSKEFCLYSIDQFGQLLRELYQENLISLNDIQVFQNDGLIFPMKIQNFIRIIAEKFNDDSIRDLERTINKMKSQINDCKSTITFWHGEGLSQKELKCLLLIFERIYNELKSIENEFLKGVEPLNLIKENIEQLKDQFCDVNDHQVITSQAYQQEEAQSLEEQFFEQRVRDVHYRNIKPIVLKKFQDGISIQIGYCKDHDFPVEVIKIPKLYMDFEKLETKVNSLNAYKELFFSKYFPKYLGFNSQCDPNYNLYFIEYQKGQYLDKISKNQKYQMTPQTQLFSLWIRDLFQAFKDILLKTQYMPILPIKLENILVTDSGLKIFLKNVEFSHLRSSIDECHEILEQKLLQNFGNLTIQILGCKSNEDQDFLNLNAEFRNFLNGFLDVQTDPDHYNPDDNYLTFSKMVYHPYLDNKYIQSIDVIEVIEDFNLIYNQ